MKKITAIVRAEKLEVLKDALFAADVRGMTINQVQGCGAQHGWKEYVRGNELLVNTIPKVQFTLICADDTHTLYFFANCTAPSAQNTFVIISHHMGCTGIQFIFITLTIIVSLIIYFVLTA